MCVLIDNVPIESQKLLKLQMHSSKAWWQLAVAGFKHQYPLGKKKENGKREKERKCGQVASLLLSSGDCSPRPTVNSAHNVLP